MIILDKKYFFEVNIERYDDSQLENITITSVKHHKHDRMSKQHRVVA